MSAAALIQLRIAILLSALDKCASMRRVSDLSDLLFLVSVEQTRYDLDYQHASALACSEVQCVPDADSRVLTTICDCMRSR